MARERTESSQKPAPNMHRRDGKKYYSVAPVEQASCPDNSLQLSETDTAKILSALSGLREELRCNDDAISQNVPHQNDGLAGDVSPRSDDTEELKSQLAELSEAILETKRELAHLSDPTLASKGEVRAATLELDAVVNATEAATNDIMSAAELIDDLASRLKSQASNHHDATLAEEINDKVVNIFEACNFQDITGQRITKVVNTLNYIDDRVNTMMELWGAEQHEAAEIGTPDDANLLNGPSMEGEGASQDDIDALFE